MMRVREIDHGVRVINAYDNFRVGQIIFPPALLREALIRTRRCEAVAPASAASAVKKPGLIPRLTRTARNKARA